MLSFSASDQVVIVNDLDNRNKGKIGLIVEAINHLRILPLPLKGHRLYKVEIKGTVELFYESQLIKLTELSKALYAK